MPSFHASPLLPTLFVALAAPSLGASPGDEAAEHAAFREILKEGSLELDPGPLGVGKLVDDLPFVDVEGRTGHLSDYADREALVIVIRQIGCPVCERYGARLARLEREFEPRGVAFLYVNMDTYLDAEEVQREERDAHGLRGRYAHDPDEVFGHALGVDTTTVTFVLDAARTLRYRGAVDDQFGRGLTRLELRQEFLREALEEVLAHDRVTVPATSAPGCALGIERQVEPTAPVDLTFYRDVSRILQAHCVECHVEGGAAPFSLESYEEAYDRRRMIRLVVEQRIMPPWYASGDSGPWKNDRRLNDEDRATILAWIANGAQAGDPDDAPVPLRFREGWLIGEPDEIFRLNEEKELPAEGVIEWDPILADRVVPRDMWIQRMQILPTDATVVHHVMVYYLLPQPAGERGREALVQALVPWSPKKREREPQFLFTYLPGMGPRSYQNGVARLLPRGARLIFDMHYTPQGKATRDRTALGLVLADEPPSFVVESCIHRNVDIQIPPGSRPSFSRDLQFHADVVLRSLAPHMHYRGASFTSDLTLPDGTRRRLLDIPVWDADWQFAYVFSDPPILPAGSRLRLTGTFDNTPDNPTNPDPTQWVSDGPQIWDEMLGEVVEWVRPRADLETGLATDEVYEQRGTSRPRKQSRSGASGSK